MKMLRLYWKKAVYLSADDDYVTQANGVRDSRLSQ